MANIKYSAHAAQITTEGFEKRELELKGKNEMVTVIDLKAGDALQSRIRFNHS